MLIVSERAAVAETKIEIAAIEWVRNCVFIYSLLER
jgi:hypothetical protein